MAQQNDRRIGIDPANPEKSLIELLPQLPLEQSHLPDAQRYAAYQPRRETFRRLYQQLLPLMA